MIVTPGTYARQIQTAATKLGATLPEKFTKTLTTAQRLTENAAQYDAVAAELNARAVELLLADKNPADDKEVQRLAVQRVLADAGLRQAGADRAAALCATTDTRVTLQRSGR
jgi:hypothetical protein